MDLSIWGSSSEGGTKRAYNERAGDHTGERRSRRTGRRVDGRGRAYKGGSSIYERVDEQVQKPTRCNTAGGKGSRDNLYSKHYSACTSPSRYVSLNNNGCSLVHQRADETSRLVESLLHYLPDRRAKLASVLETFNISAAQSHRHSTLAESSVDDLFALPNSPLRSLTPDQLVRCAQVVDTALFKTYFIVRPGLIGSFCRRDNWCEVAEMEGMLQERGLKERSKFADLIYLYNLKKMHSQALDLLEK